MDLRQQHAVTPDIMDGSGGQSVPPTPISPIGPSQDFYGSNQTSDFISQASYSPTAAISSSSAKPFKRKRLAKACDSCHRSKRRCTGVMPCANCEFAGKECTYTDPSGRAVAPPRTRSVDLRPGHDGWPYPALDYSSIQRVDPVPTTMDPSPSSLNAMMTRELVNLFFAHCHPATLIIHRSSFLSDLSRSQVPTYLLLGVFALAAPYSLQPSLRTSHSWHAGDRFATEAITLIFGDTERTVDQSEVHGLRIRPCLELAQTLCLLQTHQSVMRRPGKTGRYMALAREILQVLGVLTLDHAPPVTTYDGYVRNEAMRRTFWHIYHVGLLASASSRQRPAPMSESLKNLRLPLEEDLFDLPRLETRPGVQPVHDYLPLPAGNRLCQSEFANLIRVTQIYARAVSATKAKARLLQSWGDGQSADEVMHSTTALEVDLRRWLELLPDHLRLTEDNLQSHLSQLDGGAGGAAWAFTYMHALAETTVLALHEFANVGTEAKGARTPALREQKAFENLTMILRAMGQRGRANLMMATFLVAIGEHVSPQHPQVVGWFDEYFRMWGVSALQMMDVEFRASWFPIGPPVGSRSPSRAASRPTLDFDYEVRLNGTERYKRKLSGSDSSSAGRSVGPSNYALLADGGVGTSLPIAHYFGTEDESQILGEFSMTSEVSMVDGMPEIRLLQGGEAAERLGALALAAAINKPLQTGGAERRLSYSSAGDSISDKTRRKPLPTLMTHGLTARASRGVNNQHGYAQMPSSDGTGKSEGSDNQSMVDSPSVNTADNMSSFTVQPGRYASLSPFTNQPIEDSDLMVEWLADGVKM